MSEELREANKKVVYDYLTAMNSWDFDRMQPLLADDYHFDMLFPAPGLPMGIDGPDAMRAFQEQFAEIVETEGIHDSFRTIARLEDARVRRRRALAYLHKDLTAARGAPTCRAGLVCAATRSIARPRGRVTRWSSSRSRGRPRSGRRRDAARAAGQ